ncbi:hypothetical protein ACQPW1_29160 [Nocardia sp. CA-128927]|uniref:hypothetical protein n=1 Tax=Nocardia sp. CA-128927 TaxID=3239975 RepID=UPI003D97C845
MPEKSWCGTSTDIGTSNDSGTSNYDHASTDSTVPQAADLGRELPGDRLIPAVGSAA